MKYILLAVTGLSPQVITETLFALYQNNQKVDSIHVLTTRAGKEKIYANLLGGPNGHYYKFLEEYGIDKFSINFSHDNIHVVTDEYGNEISDILNQSDNEWLLKKCLELTFRFTTNPDTAVYFSVAGGRKTMSSCLTLSAQLYGRHQDRLYHVLVSPEFESCRDFYYPPKESKTIKLKGKDTNPFYKDSKFASINLINIPFISIRDHLSPDFLKEPKDPATLMLSLIKDDQARLTINLITKKLIYKKMEMDMMPNHLALYAFFIMKKKECHKNTENCLACKECFLESSEIEENKDTIAKIYKKICGTRPTNEMSQTGIIGLESYNFNSLKSKIKKRLLETFGCQALKEIEITSTGSRPDTKYGILIDKKKIEIIY